MTTIIVDTPINLKKTTFKDADTLITALLQSEFEAHLDTQYQKTKSAPKSDFFNL